MEKREKGCPVRGVRRVIVTKSADFYVDFVWISFSVEKKVTNFFKKREEKEFEFVNWGQDLKYHLADFSRLDPLSVLQETEGSFTFCSPCRMGCEAAAVGILVVAWPLDGCHMSAVN
jgi:hypothetical protein